MDVVDDGFKLRKSRISFVSLEQKAATIIPIKQANHILEINFITLQAGRLYFIARLSKFQ